MEQTKISVHETGLLSLGDTKPRYESLIKGHVIFKDPETHNIVFEKDNLVLLRTRVLLFQHLFGVSDEDTENQLNGFSNIIDKNRTICLFSVGSGGADINAAAFNPYVPKFSDRALSQPVPFVIVDKNKDTDIEKQDNPSIITALTDAQKKIYYNGIKQEDESIYYFYKAFESSSKGLIVDKYTGEVKFSISMKIEPNECRSTEINELGTFFAVKNSNGTISTTDSEGNSLLELASRITFDTESLSSLTKGIEIEYIFYI